MVDARLRVLVTGGAGFIGSHIVHAYVANGAEVVVLDDLSGGDARNVPADADLVIADISERDTTTLVARLGPNLLVHAAAQVSVSRSVEDPARDASVNVDGTAHVLAGLRRRRCRIVLLSSGGAIYADNDGADESSEPRPISPYGWNKRRAEVLIEQSGLSYGIARLANVYGPGQRANLEGGVVAIFAQRIAQGTPLAIAGTGYQRRDFVHVSDVVRAVAMIADADRGGTWNVGTGRSTSILELAALMQSIAGRLVGVTHESPRPGDVFESRLRIERIRAELGWEPQIDLVAGLAETLLGEPLAT